MKDQKLIREAELLVDEASELVDKAIDLEPNVLSAKAETTKKSIDQIRRKLEDQVIFIHPLFRNFDGNNSFYFYAILGSVL